MKVVAVVWTRRPERKILENLRKERNQLYAAGLGIKGYQKVQDNHDA